MKRTLLIALALLICGSAAFAGAVYELPLSGSLAAIPTGASSDGAYVSYNYNADAYLWSRATGASSLIGTGYTTAGVATMGSTAIVGGNTGGTAQVYVGGTGWSILPQADSINWTAVCTGSNGVDTYWIGGQQVSTGAHTINATRYVNSPTVQSTATLQLPLTFNQDAYLMAVSNNGHFVGYANQGGTASSARNPIATPYAGGDLMGMNTYEGVPSTGTQALVLAISKDGRWGAGWSNPGGATPVLWDLANTSGTPVVKLKMQTGREVAYATAINGDGSKVYGWNRIGSDNSTKQGFIWDRATDTTTDLMAYFLSKGVDMSAAGWTQIIDVKGVSADGMTITGTGKIGGTSGVTHGWVVVIPEPTSIMALLTGLGGLLVVRKRK